MPGQFRTAARVALAILAAAVVFGLEVNEAFAQSSNCAQLNRQLKTFDRNGDYRSAQGNSQEAKALAASLQDTESAYVRAGCSQMVKTGQTLTRDCRNMARIITRGRAQLADLQESVETGNAIAQQREAILQELARFDCSAKGSSVTITQQQPERETLFDSIFGGFTVDGDFADGDIVGDEFSGFSGYTTIRTVCVRLSDGYFWPVSYSTLPEYAGNDAMQCEAQCPGSPTELYYYDNPGQEPEQMISLSGAPYSSLPNAFRYRTEFDRSTSCKVPVPQGNIQVVAGENGTTKAYVEFAGEQFPLPVRDPRRTNDVTVAAVTVAEFIDVPLPRKRPPRDGEPVPVQAVTDTADTAVRLVQFGDKVVRVVGPDTPYAQPTGAGT